MPAPVQQVRQGDATSAPVSGGYQQINATPDAFGAGAALQQAGAMVGKAAETADRAAIRIGTEDNEAAAKAADTTFNGTLRGTLFDPEKGYLNLKGKDAVDAYKPTMEALQKARDDAAGTIKSPEARRMFLDIAQRRQDAALDTMAKHAAIERRTFLDGVSIARATDAGSDAVAYAADPAKREASLNVGRAEIIQFGADHGESPEVTRSKLRDYQTKAYVGIVKRMAVDDPMGAKAYYEANRQKIDGQQQGPIESLLKEATGRWQATADANEVMGVGVGGGVPSSAEMKKRVADGIKFWEDDGYGKHVGAGIIANFLHESGFRTDNPNPKDGADGSDSIGIAHWNSDRAEALKKFVAANGGNFNDVNTQLKFAKSEIDANPALKAKLQAAKTATEAATIFTKEFERPKDADTRAAERSKTADKILAENGGASTGDPALDAVNSATGTAPAASQVKTASDPKAVARDFEANLASYIEKAKALYANDPERLDKALTEIKQRAATQELVVRAQEKADTTAAWQIAITPNAAGAKPTSQDAIPPDLWVRLDPLHQKALQAQFEHNAKATQPPDNPALYYALNREAQDDPDAFKARDLFLVKAALPDHRWDDLVHLQRSIVKGDSKDYKITDALNIAHGPLRQAGFDLSPTANAKDKAVLGAFTSSLQDWLTRYQTENKKPPKSEEVLKQVDQMLIQGRVRGEGYSWLGDKFIGSSKQVEGPPGQKGTRGSKPNHTFNFNLTPEQREKFYVPFDEIPEARREAMEQILIKHGRLPAPTSMRLPGVPASPMNSTRRKVIEDEYATFLAGGGK